uniref:Uncharacterized protein n=1 Tax=Aulacomnium heterostichum associated tymo-like virus TaxID=2933119 RepID=A0A9C7GXB6_9VIRU|nr:hypothetical protein [Aulacomnium heterostichum associated tymo-like virus]CAI5383966.1 hypothetical protein [Aulacomnium heterostichum associated tymo-like virus]
MNSTAITLRILIRALTLALHEIEHPEIPPLENLPPSEFDPLPLPDQIRYLGRSWNYSISGPDNSPTFTITLPCGCELSGPSKKATGKLASEHQCPSLD